MNDPSDVVFASAHDSDDCPPGCQHPDHQYDAPVEVCWCADRPAFLTYLWDRLDADDQISSVPVLL